ncbi:hypothetical protein PG996_001136 [Apiospora saccharicola]|uniref:Uncharacterized protein n=1 Tax=Apiospora saccharicola TaxID=335842 RepID=A0ABR1WIQ1_9PEZI
MLLAVVLTLAASCSALSVPRKVDEARQALLIPYVSSYSPSGRPGNWPYCQITFNVTDAATNDGTQCQVQYGPCAYSGERPPEMPKPDASKPAKCQDEDFQFWFSKFDSMRNFSLEITHIYHDKDNGSDVVHTGDSGWINSDLTRDRGYSFACGGSGVCGMGFLNETDPLVVSFI